MRVWETLPSTSLPIFTTGDTGIMIGIGSTFGNVPIGVDIEQTEIILMNLIIVKHRAEGM